MSAEEIAHALGRAIYNGKGWWSTRCCCHDDRRPSLSLRDGDAGKLIVKCWADCDRRDILAELRHRGWLADRQHYFSRPARKALTKVPVRPSVDNRGKALWLWQRSQPIKGTVAEIYLRRERHICCPLPATLRFLPGDDRYPPAMIAAFVIPCEFEPGKLSVNVNDIAAVHLTKLTRDGRKHPDVPNKIMLGSAPGVPIVVGPMNDLLGLAITEGIEDALSVFEATRCGVWVAGCADRMPRLAAAIPSWVECVTICADDDEPGRKNAYALAELLHQRGGVEIKVEGLP
jgi:hypothetical protein